MAKNDVVVRFGGDVKDLQKAVRTMNGDIARMGATVSELGSKFGALAGAISAGVGGAGAIGLLNEFSHGLVEIGRQSKSLDLTVERFDELRYAVERITGLGAEDLADVLKTLREKIGDAAREAGAMREAFEALGLSMHTLTTIPVDQALLQVVGALATTENQYRAASVATEIFEDKSQDMLLLAKSGVPVIEEYAEAIRKTGTATTAGAEKAAAYAASMAQLSTSMEAIANEYGPGVIGAIDRFISKIPAARSGTQDLAVELEVWQEKLEELREEASGPNWLERMIWGQGRSKDDVQNDIKFVEEQIERLLAKKAKLETPENNRTPAQSAAQGINDSLITEEEEKDKDRDKEKDKRKKESKERQLSDTRALVVAEGAYWQAEHDLVSSLQDKNAKAVEDSRERMKKAIEDMRQANASVERTDYYDRRAGVSDEDALPKATFTPVVDAAGLAQMPKIIQAALDGANFTLTVQPILAPAAESELEWVSDQEGHDEP